MELDSDGSGAAGETDCAVGAEAGSGAAICGRAAGADSVGDGGTFCTGTGADCAVSVGRAIGSATAALG